MLAAAVALAACAAPEQALLDRFFGASRLRDTTALQAISTVIFEPLQQGIVRTFRITAVTAERADGHAVTKDVTVDAMVVLPDGRTVEKTLVVTLQRGSGDNSGRWMVTAVRDAAPSRSAPPS
ncbi:MAG TPA: hypothetical protein VGJ39_16775 [Vicinamibacterales bacterium]